MHLHNVFAGLAVPLIVLMAAGCGGSDSSAPASGNATNQSDTATTKFSQGGMVSGLPAGVTITLTNLGGEVLQVAANGPFKFATLLAYGEKSLVSVQRSVPGISCSAGVQDPALGTTGDVTNIAVSCAPSVVTDTAFVGSNRSFEGQSVLLQASDGNFYYTTVTGGSTANYNLGPFVYQPDYGRGAAYKIPLSYLLNPEPSVIHSFGVAASDPGSPQCLTLGTDGNFYGISSYGGTTGNGAFYKMASNGNVTVIHSFSSDELLNQFAGCNGLMLARDGNFYGTMTTGGAYPAASVYGSSLGQGILFKMSSAGDFSLLHSFGAAGDGAHPAGKLIQAANGDLYGTTPEGGANNGGTIFSFTASGAYKLVHSFETTSLPNATNYPSAVTPGGSAPLGALTQASDGYFYGVTQYGGNFGYGVFFKISAAGAKTVLYHFGQTGDGSWHPVVDLLLASDGSFYGGANNSLTAAVNGGGALYKLTPQGQFSLLGFRSGTPVLAGGGVSGFSVYAALVEGSDGHLYAIDSGGGFITY